MSQNTTTIRHPGRPVTQGSHITGGIDDRPRLYEDNPAAMAAPLSKLFEEMGIRFIHGTLTSIRAVDHEVESVDADHRTSTITYDRLVLAAGSAACRPDISGLNEHAFSVDQRDDAAALEVRLHSLADKVRSPTRNTIVVAGGGFTGLEIATELPARMRRILGADDPVRIIIVERADDVGPELGDHPEIAHHREGTTDGVLRGDKRPIQLRLRPTAVRDGRDSSD